tara:strand:- start:7459 stop:7863 length:405 start_codon:yes stop_codon:yes gene_type:complete
MTASVPNSISSSALEDLFLEKIADNVLGELNQEAEDEKQAEKAIYAGHTAEQMLKFVDEHTDAAIDTIAHPMVHKLMVLKILDQMITWHEDVAEKELDKGKGMNALSWAVDLGKLKAAYETFQSVSLGDDDFTF